MSNPLFNMMRSNQFGNATGIIEQFHKFKQSFNGNPQQQVQELLNSGKVTQEQYNQAVQQAKALQKMLGI